MRQEILYGDQSFFEEISYVEQDPPLVIDLHNHCKGHIVINNIYEKKIVPFNGKMPTIRRENEDVRRRP